MSRRAAEIVETLRVEKSSAEVFEAFEKLDALPPEEVRAALEPIAGPAPDPKQLDEAVRIAHGFPPPPLVLRCTSRIHPTRLEQLLRVQRDQLRRAGKMWDDVDLDVSQRLAESEFAGSLEFRAFADAATGVSVFDVVLYGLESGTVFQAGTSHVAGAIAYGVVEMKDRWSRAGLQAALPESGMMSLVPPTLLETPSEAAPTVRFGHRPTDDAEATVVMNGEARRSRPKRTAVRAVEIVPEDLEITVVMDDEDEEAGAATVEVAVPWKRAASKKKSAAPSEELVATKTSAAKKKASAKVATKKATATTTTKPAAKKTAAKPAAKKTAAKATTKKTAAKATTKKTAAKATTKKTAAKATTKKTAAKATTKKAAAKATTKKTAAKATAKKTAAKATTKKAAAKPAAKKTAAKATTKKTAAKATTKKKSERAD